MKKIIYLFLGILTFVLGTVGIFIPFLPTTLFYLSTAFFWLRSSEKLYQRFIQSKHYQTHIQEGIINKKMMTKTMVGLFLVMFLIPGVLVANIGMRLSLAGVYLAHILGLTYYLKRKTPDQSKKTGLGSLND